MIPLPLLQIVLDTVVFFGLSDDDVVDPDIAVRYLELFASTLRKLPSLQRQEFLDFVENVADSEESAGGHASRIQFMRQIGKEFELI